MITPEAANHIDGLEKYLEFYDMEESLHDGEIDEFNYNSKEGLNMLIWHRGIYVRLRFIGTLNISMCDSEFCPGNVSPNSTIREFTVNITKDEYQPLEVNFDLVGINIKCKRMEIVDVCPDPEDK